MLPFRGEIHLKPRPLNWILVALRDKWSFAVLTEELAVVHPRRVANDFLQDTPFNIIHRLDSFTWSILIKLYFLQHDRVSNYDRTFHVKTDYCSKLHRDDRVHTRGLNVNAEVSRTVRI